MKARITEVTKKYTLKQVTKFNHDQRKPYTNSAGNYGGEMASPMMMAPQMMPASQMMQFPQMAAGFHQMVPQMMQVVGGI